MNTWVVGNVPITFRSRRRLEQDATMPEMEPPVGVKTFFMKSRIMAGRVDLTNNALGIADYQWLDRDELGRHIHRGDYATVKPILALR